MIIDFDDDESSDEESWIQSNMITNWTGTPVVHNVFTYKILFISNNCVLYAGHEINASPEASKISVGLEELS
jgi:hypothetical protein